MASKTMTVREKSYEELKSVKNEDESFSDVIDRVLAERKPDYFKIVGILSDEEAENMRKAIKKARKENLKLSEERRKRLGL